MSREQFQAIFERMMAEVRRIAHSDPGNLRRAIAEMPWLSKEERDERVRQARSDLARLLAACDQFDSAKREVPRSWWPPGEEDDEL